jgi:hypothetical protein
VDRKIGWHSDAWGKPREHSVPEKKSTLIVFGGLLETGKSALARAVAEEHSAHTYGSTRSSKRCDLRGPFGQ